MPAGDAMRLDGLAAAAGLPTSTIRLYRQRKLLHPPRVVGRTGWFDETHLARLRLIARLRDEGFSLAGIRKVIDSWEQGHDLDELVGVEEQLDQLLHPRAPVQLDVVSLAERLPAGSLTPELVQRAVELELLEIGEDGTLLVPDPRFLEIGVELAKLGIPLDVILDEWEHLAHQTDDIADRFVALFETHLLPRAAPRFDTAQTKQLADVLARLQRNARKVVLASLEASLAKITTDRLATVIATSPEA